jgi:hypothetical protein
MISSIFIEYSTLVSVFPDNIQLSCDAGECVNEQDYLDVGPIVSYLHSLK